MTESASLPDLPAFDASALRRMTRDVEDQGFASVFARHYRQMLPDRVNRISLALLDDDDLDAALDATLSLKVSSVTVGTSELASLAQVIEANLRRRDVEQARTVAAQLGPAVARADEALAAYLGA